MPVQSMVHKMVDVVSKGGNMLFNVGPDETGRIPQAAVERLEAFGRWMDVNGEGIYATEPYQKSADEHVRYTRRGDTL